MSDLLELMLEAQGGLKRWNDVTSIDAEFSAVGGLWARKGWPEALRDSRARATCRQQFISYLDFLGRGRRSEWTPEKVSIMTDTDQVVASRDAPRAAFDGHTLATPWDELHLAYFCGYAMWNYLNTPFIFAQDGMKTREIEPWDENGEVWRRLHVTFPERIATHSTEQVFYANDKGVLMRLDYSAPVTGAPAVAHYLSEHKTFDGIVVPTKRRAYPRGPDGKRMGDTAIVLIDFTAMSFQ